MVIGTFRDDPDAPYVAADALIVGAPTYFGSMASPVKRLFEDAATGAQRPDRSRPWRHALAAGDAAWAAQLVERNVEALLGRSEGATLRRWLSALPPESVRDRPRLGLAQADSAAQGFQPVPYTHLTLPPINSLKTPVVAVS